MTIFQEGYVEKLLRRFGMTDCKPRPLPIEFKLDVEYGDGINKISEPYRELLGSLMYLMLGTSYTVNKMSRYQEVFVPLLSAKYRFTVSLILKVIHFLKKYFLFALLLQHFSRQE